MISAAAMIVPAVVTLAGLVLTARVNLRGLFAPALSHHDGTFFLVCTMIDGGGNFLVTAKNPAGEIRGRLLVPGDAGGLSGGHKHQFRLRPSKELLDGLAIREIRLGLGDDRQRPLADNQVVADERAVDVECDQADRQFRLHHQRPLDRLAAAARSTWANRGLPERSG